MRFISEIKIIWSYLRKYKKRVYLISFFALLGAGMEAIIPYIYGRLVDIVRQPQTTVKFILAILGLWLVLRIIIDLISRAVRTKGHILANEAAFDLVIRGGSQLLRLPLKFHKDKKMGEIISRIERGGDYLEGIMDNVVFSTLPAFFTVAVALVIMAKVQWLLAFFVSAFLIFYALVTIIKVKPIVMGQKKINKATEKVYGDFYDSILNIQTVKSSAAEDLEKKKYVYNFKDFLLPKLKIYSLLWQNLSAWQSFIYSFGFVATFGVALYLLRQGAISAGELVMFIGYIFLVFTPFAQIAWQYRTIRNGITAIQRVHNIMGLETEQYEKEGALELKAPKGEIVFEDVSFGYTGGQSVLEDISFKAKAGQTIAIVGESGVGKTTLVDLISRYYAPVSGRILIDGADIGDVALKSLRENIAVVPQEITLFNDTIKNNIKYGKPSSGNKKIIEAAKAANAHQFIQKFPKKYNQLVGERGIKLSTGQKQRIAISRALLRNPKILILDEATSSLDIRTEKLVQEALGRLVKGRTTFIIAHRLSTIVNADKILVLEKGRLVQQGTHGQLIKEEGGYKKLYSMQAGLMNHEI